MELKWSPLGLDNRMRLPVVIIAALLLMLSMCPWVRAAEPDGIFLTQVALDPHDSRTLLP